MIACGLQLLIGTMAITRAIGSPSTPHVNSMKQTGDLVSGFSDTVIYSFATEAYTKEFLSLLTPLADSVLETEAGFSYTFRPFVAQDGLSVMIMERFVDQAAHDGPHASSSVHHDYLAKVDAWNSTTGAITGKVHGDWSETSMGSFVAFSNDATTVRTVSGFADTVIYSLRDTTATDQFLTLLKPLATYVRDNENFTYTFRPFVAQDGLSVLIIERFLDQASHDGPHANSAVHKDYLHRVAAWNASYGGKGQGAIVGKLHADWIETDLGVLSRPLLAVRWMNYSYVTSGWNLCNNATSVCRSLGHWVFTVTHPTDLAATITAGASFKVDDGEYGAATVLGRFEAHLVNGQCASTSDVSTCVLYDNPAGSLGQVFNVGWDQIFHNSLLGRALPKRVCAKIWAVAESSDGAAAGGQGGVGLMSEELCADFQTATVDVGLDRDAAVPHDMLYSASAEVASYLCGKTHCRANAHISFDVELQNPTDQLLSVTDYSVDGTEWTSASSVTFMEQKAKLINGTFYQTLSWNYDAIIAKSARHPKEICFKVWVQNLGTDQTWNVDFGDYATPGKGSYVRCLNYCEHAMPFSYAVAAGGYCGKV